jgi:hypothetical protein
MPSAKLFFAIVVITIGMSEAACASPLILKSATLVESSQQFQPARWRYRYYRGSGLDEERLYELPRQGGTTVQSADPAIQMLRFNSRRGGRWIDPPAPR